MRPIMIFLTAFFMLTGAAAAQKTADQMSCAEAKAYFAANGVIYKRVHGSVLPITRGIPISRSGALICQGPRSVQMTYGLATLDKRNCTISTYCTGEFRLIR